MEIDAKNTSLAFEENLMKLHERGESMTHGVKKKVFLFC